MASAPPPPPPGEPPHGPDSSEEQLEREALGKVVLAFRRYQVDANLEVDRWQYNFMQLPPHQQILLANQKAKYSTARQCIYNNQFFIKSMLAAFDPETEGNAPPSMLAGANAAADSVEPRTLPGDTEKVRYVLKNLVRDWSSEGVAERDASYGKMVTELQQLFKAWPSDSPTRPRVLVPGAGLARLCCEVAGAGFETQGNEFAYFMLITSSFILNNDMSREQYTIFPWVTGNCNNVADADQLRGVSIPDVCPVEIVSRAPFPGLLSMAAGDFVEVYSTPDQANEWDAVATCFFIDTAHNIMQYLEVLYHCIKPGGYWVNLGPLLYHWADGYGMSEMSVELSLAEIKRVAQGLGFELIREETVEAPYIANTRSMFQTVYQASFFTMRKTGKPVIPLPPPHTLPNPSHGFPTRPAPPAGPAPGDAAASGSGSGRAGC